MTDVDRAALVLLAQNPSYGGEVTIKVGADKDGRGEFCALWLRGYAGGGGYHYEAGYGHTPSEAIVNAAAAAMAGDVRPDGAAGVDLTHKRQPAP